MASVRMDEARYFEHGSEQIVQLPGAALRDGNIHYDPLTHKGALKCRFCDVAVHYSRGSQSICGDNLAGQSPHFRTNRDQTHDESCQWPARVERFTEDGKYDDSKGYKIHLNTSGYPAHFGRHAGQVYDRDADRKIITLRGDIAGRRPKSVRSVQDVIELMKPSDAARLRDSVVVHHAHVLPWDSFFVRYNRKEGGNQVRFKELADRLRTSKSQPCMMEFNLVSGVWPRDLFDRKALCVRSEPIDLGVGDDGRALIIQPQAWLDNPDNTLVSCGMAESGRYLVMGYAKLHTVSRHDRVVHYVNISVEKPEQLARLDIANLGLK